jgi:hypothetical protein
LRAGRRRRSASEGDPRFLGAGSDLSIGVVLGKFAHRDAVRLGGDCLFDFLDLIGNGELIRVDVGYFDSEIFAGLFGAAREIAVESSWRCATHEIDGDSLVLRHHSTGRS